MGFTVVGWKFTGVKHSGGQLEVIQPDQNYVAAAIALAKQAGVRIGVLILSLFDFCRNK